MLNPAIVATYQIETVTYDGVDDEGADRPGLYGYGEKVAVKIKCGDNLDKADESTVVVIGGKIFLVETLEEILDNVKKFKKSVKAFTETEPTKLTSESSAALKDFNPIFQCEDGNNFTLEEITADVEAAKDRFSYTDFCFTYMTVEALINFIKVQQVHNNALAGMVADSD